MCENYYTRVCFIQRLLQETVEGAGETSYHVDFITPFSNPITHYMLYFIEQCLEVRQSDFYSRLLAVRQSRNSLLIGRVALTSFDVIQLGHIGLWVLVLIRSRVLSLPGAKVP